MIEILRNQTEKYPFGLGIGGQRSVTEMPFKLGLKDQERFHQAKRILSNVQLNFACHTGHKVAAERLRMACRCF